jgi:Na+:H+ antiporter, NhaA family
VYPPKRSAVERATVLTRSFRQDPSPAQARSAMLGVGAAISPNERLQEALHPWTSYVIVPLFALANAGVELDSEAIERAVSSPITLGVVLGLVAGKAAGISLSSLLAVRLGLGSLPRGVQPRHLLGAASLAGIGFTVSLFIADLAFSDPALRDEAKLGVLAASVIAAGLGWTGFRIAARGADEDSSGTLTRLDPPVDRAHDHIRGRLDASLSLVEYGDVECPYCGAVTGVVDDLRERYGDRLQYVFRHLPLEDSHPHARLAAEALEAAGAQGRFWEMHDRLFAEQDRLELDDLVGHAQALGMDAERFLEALHDEVHEAAIDADVDSAERSGVTGTPTFFVNGQRHAGPHTTKALAEVLDRVAG